MPDSGGDAQRGTEQHGRIADSELLVLISARSTIPVELVADHAQSLRNLSIAVQSISTPRPGPAGISTQPFFCSIGCLSTASDVWADTAYRSAANLACSLPL
jgi:hypothetical protein